MITQPIIEINTYKKLHTYLTTTIRWTQELREGEIKYTRLPVR